MIRDEHDRNNWVDCAKAIGIVLVVYGHVMRGLFNAGFEVSEHYVLIDSIIYSFHMPLFFFLSGLFFYRSLEKRKGVNLMFNKLDTILYPYIIWSIAQGFIEASLSNYTNGNVTFTQVLSLWEPRAQFWFLYALFLVFIVSTFIFTFLSGKHALAVFFVSCGVYISAPLLLDSSPLLFIANNMVYFSLGVVFSSYELSKNLDSLKSLLLTMITFLLSQYLFHFALGKHYTDQGAESLYVAVVSIIFVVSLSISISRKNVKLVTLIGSSSMAIYLMHIVAGSGARVLLGKGLGIQDTNAHLLVGCLAGLLLPLVAVKAFNLIGFPYAFSAPISRWFELFQRQFVKLARIH
ncbi:acyltransferase [Vibrio europaeus]|uniref:Acyltransferase n=1 Tax=Vibrio europaeus TaxID=300876 RepID=A0A178J9F9_9VIBR|nr:acyltransferase [Vibrio europaeus]MDC5705011.1 acyltransferase [Vibrio europaeus]MDC5710290.1 acyltransferase [Vibrio europaeus]MDC5715380.1 acyltransferase [Vibrio europaeus]MDC5719541.1 acyltransferase [Vibrio europaeus]MDC5724571.1 acyltransferase [Vibrio europaeus]